MTMIDTTNQNLMSGGSTGEERKKDEQLDALLIALSELRNVD